MSDQTEIERQQLAVAETVADLAQRGGWTVGTAESVTAGHVVASLAAAPEASSWLRGSVVAYATEVKHTVLQVPDCPVVSRACAEAMSEHALEVLGADVVVATTGVGGPEPADGVEPGTVWISVAGLGRRTATVERFSDRSPSEVVRDASLAALRVLAERLDAALPQDGGALAAAEG